MSATPLWNFCQAVWVNDTIRPVQGFDTVS